MTIRDLSGWIFIFLIGIVILSLVNLYSATHQLGTKAVLFKKQICWIGIGFIALLLFNLIDYRKLLLYAYHIYVITLCLLSMVLFFSPKIMGAKRWLVLGIFTLQPSELSKLVLIIILSYHFSKTETGEQGLKSFIIGAILTFIPVFLIILEPDLGTALILLILFVSLCIFAHVKPKCLLGCVLITLLASPFIWHYGLKAYQKARIIAFLSPQKDPYGIGYHVTQSKIAVGSGKLWGKGFLKGTQTQLRFLPEHYTDFIFSVFAEEWGFIGCMVLLGLYLGIILTGLKICQKTIDSFSYLLATGIVAMFFWQMLINIGMSLGLLPVVGVPLPFMSYGGSAILTNFIAFGILMKIGKKRLLVQR
jgi:rod shape determining protein RodA